MIEGFPVQALPGVFTDSEVSEVVERIGPRSVDAMMMELRRGVSPKVRFYCGRYYTPYTRYTVWDAMAIGLASGARYTRIELRWPGDIRIYLPIAPRVVS